jgi:hypothetical protein
MMVKKIMVKEIMVKEIMVQEIMIQEIKPTCPSFSMALAHAGRSQLFHTAHGRQWLAELPFPAPSISFMSMAAGCGETP